MHNDEPRQHTYKYPYRLTEPNPKTPETPKTPTHGRTGRWLHRRDGQFRTVIERVKTFVRDVAPRFLPESVRESVREFVREKAKGRGSFIGVGAAALVAVFLVGTASAIGGASAAPATPITGGEAAAAVDREVAAQRADRGTRGAPPPTGPPAATGAPAPTEAPAPKPAPAWVNPMPGIPLSSCYGPRWGSMHQGIDFAGDAGTKILSVGAGTVIAAGWYYTGYGISVVVDHGNGYLSHYAHASQTLVHEGQYVKPGQALALEGSTGDSTGPHLHFEIHEGMWNQVEPARWLRARGVDVGC